MKIRLTKLNVARIFFCLCFFLFVMTLYFEGKKLQNINYTLSDCLVKAVYEFLPASATEGEHLYSNQDKKKIYKDRIKVFKERNYQYDHEKDSILYFSDNPEWKYRTIFSEDSVISKVVYRKAGITEHQIFQQTAVFLNKQMNLDSLLSAYIRLLKKENIELNKPIYITAKYELFDTIHYKNFSDTMQIVYNYTTPVYRTGLLDEIEYQAFLNISCWTIYKAIPSSIRQFFIYLIISICFLCYFYFKDRVKKYKNEIIDLEGGYIYVGAC